MENKIPNIEEEANIRYIELKILYKRAIHEVYKRTSDANNASMATRIGEIHSLHISAYMDIEKTTKSLNNILAYKKELSLTMLRCSDEQKIKLLSEAIIYCDDMIRKVLGIHR
jgi:hypothetical protein